MEKRLSALRGMSLVEVTIVIVILGVIMAGVFMFFISGTEHFNFARRQNELDTAGRLALDRMTNEIIWAGYMPYGGWSGDDWHPIEQASEDTLVFYADWEPFRTLDDTDHRNILVMNEMIRISDNAGKQQFAGEFITDLDYEYLDQSGNVIPIPISLESDRDLIRHIRINLLLTATYGGDVYQTLLHTTVSPRNLGVNHDIDPAFVPPAPMEGIVVLNVDGSGEIQDPDPDQRIMKTMLEYWGLTVTMLTDDQLTTYDYTDVMVLILRYIEGGSHSDAAFFQSLPVPMVILSANDARDLFSMGTTASEIPETRMTPVWDHPVNRDLPSPPLSTFQVYPAISPATQSVLTGLDPSTALLTMAGVDPAASGVCVKDSADVDLRRVHLSAWDATEFTDDGGWILFYNIIHWLGAGQSEDPGEPVTTMEDFEGPGTTEQEITLWTDNINPVAMPDTVPIYYEPFTDVPALSWVFTPLGGGRVFLDAVNDRLQMDRAAAGASTRNLARLTVDLSAYNAAVDELVLSARCLSYEGAPDASDGFFFTAPGAADTLLFQNFESLSDAPGDIDFWGDLYGRYRIHNPWAGDGQYVTFDSRTDNRAARNRMMIEVATTGVPSGTPVTISFRFHDHADENHSGATGDFVGWNSHGVIDGSVNVISDLTPGSYNDTQWFNRSVTFTPATLPNPLYVVFGQYGSYRATSFSANDGITLDNIMVSVPGDTLYTQIGAPNSTPAWEWVHIDLDDAAIACGRPFAANYQIWLSQYGGQTVPNGGRLWDDVTIGRIVNTFSVPGWSHGRIGAYIDEWSPKIHTPVMGYSWVLQNPTGSTYGNGDYCWLESPPVTIPSFVQTPRLQFSHTFATENRYDGGYVQISSDGGPWVTMGTASGLTYTNTSVSGFPGGAGMWIFTGSRGWQTETVNLDAYAGHTVRFRFVFGSDGSATSTGWALDNFRVYGTTSGYEITQLQFDASAVPSPFTYDGIDVWMSAGPDVSFTGAGEWDKGTMIQVANDATLSVGAMGLQTLTLDSPFMLPPGQSLYIKIEQQDTGWSGSRIEWLCQDTSPSQMCRQAASDVSDPVVLNPLMDRPNLVVVTSDGNLTPPTGTESNNSIPLNNYNFYNDVEMIYLASELGTEGSGGEWTHGGDGDDWEIDAPVFLSIDPPLVPDNLSNVAGNDLTVNGLYNPDSWCWMVSPAYEVPDPAVYDSVVVRFERCLRLAPNDFAYIFMGFGDTTTPPSVMSTDWHLVRQYDGTNMTAWDYEDIDITDEFSDAWVAGDDYFFIRFVLDSGPFAERGGWNLDNIQFFAVPII